MRIAKRIQDILWTGIVGYGTWFVLLCSLTNLIERISTGRIRTERKRGQSINSEVLGKLEKFREETEVKDNDRGDILVKMIERGWIKIYSSGPKIKVVITEKGKRILEGR